MFPSSPLGRLVTVVMRGSTALMVTLLRLWYLETLVKN